VKDADKNEALIKLAIELHNPLVARAYNDDPGEDTAFLFKNLRVMPDDTLIQANMKMMLFYQVGGRQPAIAPIPTFWAAKAERFRPQLAITYQPMVRRKHAHRRYDSNGLIHIPHYKATERNPKLPRYKIGSQSCRYVLKDGSAIHVFAHTEEEALKVVMALSKYVVASQKPAGGVEANCTFTKRRGKKLALDGVEMKPIQATFYERGDKSETPLFIVRL
jgi:hypothetical protein